jgi:hypothetical protein
VSDGEEVVADAPARSPEWLQQLRSRPRDLGVEPPFDAQHPRRQRGELVCTSPTSTHEIAEQTHDRCAAKEVDGALDRFVDLREELDQVRDRRASARPFATSGNASMSV